MGTKDAPVCPRHPGNVRLKLRTLHSDQSRPNQVLGVYTCPECGYERRLPIEIHPDDGDLDVSGPAVPAGAV